MNRTRKKPKSLPFAPPITAGLPAVINPSQSAEHPHQNFDRAALAAVARLSGGVSTHTIIEAWRDWAQHPARVPGRQMDLAEHAQRCMWKLATLATQPRSAPPFCPEIL